MWALKESKKIQKILAERKFKREISNLPLLTRLRHQINYSIAHIIGYPQIVKLLNHQLTKPHRINKFLRRPMNIVTKALGLKTRF